MKFKHRSECETGPAVRLCGQAHGEEVTMSVLGIGGIAHYDAEAWVRAMDFHPVGAFLNALLPKHGYIVGDVEMLPRIYANALGLAHMYRCHLLLAAS